MIKRLLAASTFAFFAAQAHSAVLLSEGFNDINTLNSTGWAQKNLSSPLGTTSFFQGNTTAFSAQTGPSDSYIGANYNNTGNNGTISNWLMTPELSLAQALTLTFFTRTADLSSFPDRLEVRLSTNGGSTDAGTSASSVGDFDTLLLSINPTLTIGAYPDTWTSYMVNVGALGGSGRFALRYFVTDAGSSGTNSNYIGIDTLSVSSDNVPVSSDVPEPTTALLMGVGLLAVLNSRRRKMGC